MASKVEPIDPGSGKAVLVERRSHNTVHREGERRGETLCGSENNPISRGQRSTYQEVLRNCPLCELIAAGEATAPITECPECGWDANANRGKPIKEASLLLADHIEDRHYGPD